MESYIVINGKKAELTEEQLKALGIVTEKKNPFAISHDREDEYFFISSLGSVVCASGHVSRSERYDNANYCTDRDLMQQRAWRETLNRLLWRYSMEHNGDKIKWHPDNGKRINWRIFYHHQDKEFCTYGNDCHEMSGDVYFYTREIAQNAIKEIVEPFMKEHPDFVW